MNDLAKNLILWVMISLLLLFVFKNFDGFKSVQDKLSYSDFIHKVENNEVNLLWEGLSSGNRDLFKRCAQIAQLVAEMSQRSVSVNFITDLDYYLISNKFFKTKTHDILTSIFKDFTVDFTLTRWTESNLQRMIAQSHVAIIPIGDDPVMRGKPENKMILFMTAGIPVIASNTPAYDRVARLIDLNCTADTKEKFADLICGLLDNKNLSKTHIHKGHKFVFEARGESVLLQKWQDLIKSVF